MDGLIPLCVRLETDNDRIACCQTDRYEIHFTQQKVVTPSTLMDKLIADSRSGTVVSLGTVIDATGGDAFLYDPKYATQRTCLLRLSTGDQLVLTG